MKILGICGSPRHNGNSEWALTKILEGCSQFAPTEQINLSTQSISFCDGCLICEDSHSCHFDDDMDNLNESILLADIILIVSPVYFDNVPAILKNVIDRTNPLCGRLQNKKAIVVTFGQADKGSWDSATQYLNNYFDIMGIEMIEAYSFKSRIVDDARHSAEIREAIEKIISEIKEVCYSWK